MSDNKKKKYIMRYGIIGLLAGLVSVIVYIMCGMFLNESIVFDLVYFVVLFFGKPFFLFFPRSRSQVVFLKAL